MSIHDELISTYNSNHYDDYMPKNEQEWEAVIDRLEVNFSKHLQKIKKDDKLLDLPCGVGYLLHFLIHKGFTNIAAVDLSEEQVNQAKNLLSERNMDFTDKIKFEIEDAFSHLITNNKYKAIFLIDILEHFDRDRGADLIKACLSSLEPGGLLFIRTPNAETPMFGRFYNDLTHITPYTVRSIKQLIQTCSLEIIDIDYEKIPYPRESPSILKQLKRIAYEISQSILAKILGLKKEAFSENIYCVCKK